MGAFLLVGLFILYCDILKQFDNLLFQSASLRKIFLGNLITERERMKNEKRNVHFFIGVSEKPSKFSVSTRQTRICWQRQTTFRSSMLVSPVLSMGSAESWTKTGGACPVKCTGCIDSPLSYRYNLKYGYWPIYPPQEGCLLC